MYPRPASLSALTRDQATVALAAFSARVVHRLSQDPVGGDHGLPDALGELDRAIVEDDPSWPARFDRAIDQAAALDPRLTAAAGLAVRLATQPSAEPQPAWAEAFAEAGLDRDEHLALALVTLDRLLGLAESLAGDAAVDIHAVRLMARAPAVLLRQAPISLSTLAGEAPEPVGAVLLEASFQAARLARAHPGPEEALAGVVVRIGEEVRRIRVDVGRSIEAFEVMCDHAAFWRRPTLTFPAAAPPSAPEPVRLPPSWGTSCPLYEQGVDRAVGQAFAALAAGEDPAWVVGLLRSRVHRDGRRILDPLRDEMERHPSALRPPGLEDPGPSPARAAAAETFDRWAGRLASAVGLSELPPVRPAPSLVEEALGTWDPAGRSGLAAADHLAAHLLHYGLPAQRNAFLAKTLGLETVWTRESDRDHLVVPYSGDAGAVRALRDTFLRSMLDGTVVRIASAGPVPPDLAAELAPVTTVGAGWVRELAREPDLTLDAAAARVPRWVHELWQVTGRWLDLDDPLRTWREIDELVLAARPPAPALGGPVEGLLAVFAVVACEALRRKAGGRLGRLGPTGWVDVPRLADVGYRPAVDTGVLMVNLGQKVFERYELGAEASVAALGAQSLDRGGAPERGVLLPCLQPWNWVGAALAVHRPLLGRMVIPGVPLVTYAEDLTVSRALRNEGDPAALEEEAVGNLIARGADAFQIRQPREGVIAVIGEYAASFLLVPGLLRRIGELVGDPSFAVAVPTREALLAARIGEPALADLVRDVTADSPVADRLCGTLFAVDDGRVVRVLEAAPAGPKVTVDGGTLRVEGLGPRDEGVVEAVRAAIVGQQLGPRMRIELRFDGPRPTGGRRAAELSVASTRMLMALMSAGFPFELVDSEALVDGEPIASALDALEPRDIGRLGLAPAAAVITACAFRGSIGPEHVAGGEAALAVCDDMLLLEAVLNLPIPLAEAVSEMATQTGKVGELLQAVGAALGRLEPVVAQQTREALASIAIGAVRSRVVMGPDGNPRLDEPERRGIASLMAMLGFRPDGPMVARTTR